ncbi:hypothetical protein LPJ57_005757 [Coemansia sp. RSA 486]|nr:hypothetical protein LPJ57_005757 [Coemansia sp. RSA 486]
MGIASDSTNGLATTRKLQQSAKSLSTLIHLLANDAILNGATVPGSALVSLTGEFLYGESKTAFVMYLGTDEGASEDLEASIDLIRSLRKLRSREIIRPVDRRVMFFFEKAKYYQSEKYRLQDELTDLQDEKEQLEKDLDDIQRDFGEERDALSREVGHWQSKSKTLEETLEALRSQSAGIEADIRWENAKLVTEALALKDELRKAEIEMTSAEDSQSKLLDLYEGLQGSYNSLDSVYSELLSAYRMLKERYGKMAESNATLQETIQELEGQAKLNEQSIKDIKGEIKKTAADSRKQVEQLENKHAEEVNELEAQISAFTQNAAELNAKVAHLETQNKSLSVSQSKEASQLQNTIQELSSQLEDVQRQAAAEASTLTSSLRSAEKLINRLETERVRLADKVDELSVNSEIHQELGAKESMWLREREQLMRQIDRYQKAIESAERRESELRDESEAQWAAWESEKNRNHQKYLKLKDRFREAVDFAADAQIQLEGAREKTAEPELDTNHGTLSNGHARKQTRRKAAPKKTAPAPAPLSIDQTRAQAIGVEDDEDTGMDVDTPTAPVHSLATKHAETASEPAHERRSTTRNRRVQPNYAESDDNEDFSFGMVDPAPSSRGRQNNGSKGKPRNKNTRSGLAARESASDNGGDSDDSEITFNTSSTTTQQKQQPKTRGRAPRAKKSAEELNAELRTQPARKRAAASGKNKASNGLSASSDAGAGDSIDGTVDGQSENAAAAAAAPLPKRKRAVQPRASKASAPKALSAGIHDSADDAAAAVAALPTAVSVAGGNGAGSNALKKKRKLNLSRMRNLLGFSADVSALSEANSHQAVKFVVPKIRTMGAAESSAALAATDPADSD